MTQARLEATRALYGQIMQANLAEADERVSWAIGDTVPYPLLVQAQSRVLKRLEAQGKALKAEMETVK